MFEDRNTENDILMRSILSNAEEEVPERVWEGVSQELDNMARRRRIMLWWRRGAVSVAAAAAVALTLVLNRNMEESLVPEVVNGGMTAVVEPEVTATEDIEIQEHVDMRKPESQAVAKQIYRSRPTTGPSSAEPTLEEQLAGNTLTANLIGSDETTESETPAQEPRRETVQEDTRTYTFEDFPEEAPSRRIRTSLVASGITGTNSTQNKGRAGAIRFPSIDKAPARTGISETSTSTIYGIPLSLGAGVRLGFTERWSLGVGLNYTLLTRKFYGTYTLVGSDRDIESSTSSDIRNSQHYIGIPVNAYYSIIGTENVNFYAYAGGTVEKCVADRYNVQSTSIVHTEAVKGVQLSAGVGIGVEFMLGRYLGLYVDPSLRYYFDCGQPKSIRTAQPLMVGLEMGLKVRL